MTAAVIGAKSMKRVKKSRQSPPLTSNESPISISTKITARSRFTPANRAQLRNPKRKGARRSNENEIEFPVFSRKCIAFNGYTGLLFADRVRGQNLENQV